LALAALTVLVAGFILAVFPTQSWAQVNCASPSATADTDSDGFSDAQECSGITLADGTLVPTCPSPIVDRKSCVDPNSKDLFIVLAPVATGSLLPAGFRPFDRPTYYGVTFDGFDDLGAIVHQISPTQALADRSVTSVSSQKAVRVTESLDATGSTLGICQWGTPNGLDGCAVFTQRINDFVSSTCAGLTVYTGSRDPSTVQELFLAYATHVILHETGHTSGGMTGSYNSSYGGYHYKSGDSRMEQYVSFSTKGGKCMFSFSSGWNSNDASTIELK